MALKHLILENAESCWVQHLKLMANLLAVPKYIKATSPEGLRRAMFQAQIKDSMQYNFKDFNFINGFWYVWYFYEPKTGPDKLTAASELAADKEKI